MTESKQHRTTLDDDRRMETLALNALETLHKCRLEHEDAYTRALSVSPDTQLRHIAVAREQAAGPMRRLLRADSFFMSILLVRNWHADAMWQALVDTGLLPDEVFDEQGGDEPAEPETSTDA